MAGGGGSLTVAGSSPDARALELAYRYLNRRERTVEEVRGYLVGRGVDVGSAEEAIQALGEQGYLDDARFARLFVQDKRALEQWGSERIRQALRTRGIDADLVGEALEDGGSVEGDRERALGLLQGRFPDPPRDRRQRERALGMLLRRGYSYEVASETLRLHSSRSAAASDQG